MKRAIILNALMFLAALCQAVAQGTAFTYQGRLSDGGSPANGTYDFHSGLYTTNSGGTAVDGLITNPAVVVSNGLFTLSLDFSNVFDGTTYWLEISLRTNGGGAFTTLLPRQELTPAPYAIFAEGASAAGLSGTVPPASLSGGYGGVVSFTNPSDSFAGNGSGLANVNAATLNGLAASNFWQLGGNTIAGPQQFLGTLNNQPLDFYANNVRALRLILRTDASGTYSNAPNIVGGSPVNLVMSGIVGGTVAGGGGNDVSANTYPNKVTANFGTVSGGLANTAAGHTATVSGGYSNYAGGFGSFVGGGGYDGSSVAGNSIKDNAAVIGGGVGNAILNGGAYGFIGGGYCNEVSIAYSVVSGGSRNVAANAWVTVGGGANNQASGPQTTIGGGYQNTATFQGGTVAGGLYNSAVGTNAGFATVSGGYSNLASDYSAVGGGAQNHAGGIGSFIGGGGNDGTTNLGNTINDNGATIGGGMGNRIPGGGSYSFIGGGYQNTARGPNSTMGGGFLNKASADASTVGGGDNNTANGVSATITGGQYNTASGFESFIGGGSLNTASGDDSTVAGGRGNTAGQTYAAVGGGYYCNAGAIGSFIGGGGFDGANFAGNEVLSKAATIGGGLGNFIPGGAEYAVISGGNFNTNSGQSATVGGGNLNLVTGDYAVVPGGQGNSALGKYSFAGGFSAVAAHNGCFLWADANNFSIMTTVPNLFAARCTGGVIFVTGIDSGGNPTAGVSVAAGGTSWSAVCDRNAKKNFQPVDTVAVLNKLATIPIEQWNYKWEANRDTPNLGPMAQDFKAAFYPGRDNKSISTLEFDGVELAAIQGLNRKVDEENAALRAQNAELKRQNETLEKRLEAVEQFLRIQRAH